VKVWAAVAVALLAAGWFGFSYAYRAGYKAGSAVTEAEWSAAMAKVRQESTAVIVAQYEKHRADVLRREGVERDLQSKLGAADQRGRGCVTPPLVCPEPVPPPPSLMLPPESPETRERLERLLPPTSPPASETRPGSPSSRTG
jgi:hypothetical protein